MSVLPACVLYTTLVPGADRDQERASDPLELKSQVAVSQRVVLGIKLKSSARAASALAARLWLPSPTPML